MVRVEEGSHSLKSDGHKVYTKTWKTEGEPKAIIVAFHGFSDHINRYVDFFNLLAANGFEVRGFDQRGWGRSVTKSSERGRTGPTRQVILDMTSFIESNLPMPNGIPLFLYGHSMGGGQVLTYIEQGPKEVKQHIRGYILESPYCDLEKDSRPSQFKVAAGRFAARLLPNVHLGNDLEPKWISRDPKEVENFRNDPLCHNTGTLEGLAGLLERAADLKSGKVPIKEGNGEGGKTRIWIGHGDADHVCDFESSKLVYDNAQIQDKEFHKFDGWYHALHIDLNPDTEYAPHVVKWINDRLDPLEGIAAEDPKSKL